MKILAIHADYLKFKPTKKALKNAEEVEEKETEVKECLVVMTAVEKKDEAHVKEVTERLVAEAEDIAKQLKAQNIVIYPYAHLSSELSKPDIAVQILEDAKHQLQKKGYTVIRAPFGWYKSFEWRCKGHPLSELSRSIDLSQPGAVITKEKVAPKTLELDLQHNNNLQNTGAFILAWAVHELFPKAIPILALSQKDSFTVDFANVKFSHTDLQKIGKKMDDFVKKNYAIKEGVVKAEHPFQNELLQAYKKQVKAFSYGSFNLLLPGSVLLTTGGVKAFSLENISGSYWKGDSNNQMLQRITGHAFKSEQDLKDFLEKLAAAQERDHRKIGQEQQLFFIDEIVGKGLPLWLPRGTIIRDAVEQFAIQSEKEAGYLRVVTPHLAKEQLYQTSGHLPYYKDSMYPPMVMDDGTYYLRGMNCPHHHIIYLHTLRSYRDLPLRLAEYGTVYRNELSGTLAGLLRVRGMAMNDAHIYCRKDQIKQEFKGVMELVMHYFKVFGLNKYSFRLSKWSKDHTDKYVNQPENWEYTQQVLREVLQEMQVPFTEADDEAAFYGPKVDVQFTSVIGREETMSTIQLDFLAKERFSLSYFDETGKKNKEVFVLHRAPLSTHERFTAFLIEHFAGKFPLWLSPVQVKFITVADKHIPFAKEVYDKLFAAGIRVELNDKPETLPKKVRDAELERVNFIVTIGDKEVDQKTLAVRSRGGKVQFGVAVDAFVKDLQEQIIKRTLDA